MSPRHLSRVNDDRSVGLKNTEENHQVLRLDFSLSRYQRGSVEDNLETLPVVHTVVSVVIYRIIGLRFIDCLKKSVSTTPDPCHTNTHSSYCELICLLYTSIVSAALFH